MKSIYIMLLAIVAPVLVMAQGNSNISQPCYTDELWKLVSAQDASLAPKRYQMDLAFSRQLSQLPSDPVRNHRSLTNNTIVIPVVIYIVHDSTAATNISMQAIQSQMDQLNHDFLTYGITFCYARRNIADISYFVPAPGDSAGVFRIYSPLTNLDIITQDLQLKQLSALKSKNYLRIFVVNSLTPQGVAGYAHFPGGNPVADGIVVRADVFGSNNFCPGCQLLSNYNLGAVLTHEVGHYLNLYHTFQGGCDTTNNDPLVPSCGITGDWICDTPPTTGSFDCPQPAPVSCNSTTNTLIENYMDYTNDQCRNSFTPGQVARMVAALNVYRQLLISPANLLKTGVACVGLSNQFADFSSQNFNGCVNQPMRFESLGSSDFTYEWEYGNGNTGSGDTVQTSFATAGQYNVTLTATHNVSGEIYTNTQTVFITTCQPNTCNANKITSGISFLDFSTGTAVAVTHPPADPDWIIPLYFQTFNRGNGQGNNFVTISWGPQNSHKVVDASWNAVDSLGAGVSAHMFPVPGHTNEHCFLYTPFYYSPFFAQSDTLVSCIIGSNNGTPYVVPGKKNIPLPVVGRARQYPPIFKVIATPDCNGIENWIITTIDDSTLNVMSIDAGRTIQFRSVYRPANLRITSLRCSPNGRKLAITCSTKSQPVTTGIMIFDFDKNTGTITPAQFLIGAGWGTFSPNSRYWYSTEFCCAPNVTSGSIYQYDLNSPNPAATRKLIYDFPVSGLGNPSTLMFNGADAKTYVGFTYFSNPVPASFRMGVINNPNLLQTGVNTVGFNRMGPSIVPQDNTDPAAWINGLSNVMDNHDAFPCFPVPVAFNWRATGCFTYSFSSSECYSATWNFGDAQSGPANTASGTSVMHTFSSAGRYPVTMVSNGQTVRDTITITVPLVHIAGTPVLPCPQSFANYSLNTIQPYVNYQWTVTNGTPATAQNTGDLNIQWLPGATTGSIKVLATDTVYGCTDSAFINLQFSPSYFTNLHDSVCSGSAYSFHNRLLTAAGTYSDTLTTASGCDSIVQLQLDTIALKQRLYNASVCQGDSYNFMGYTYTTAGLYTDTVTSGNGCDSIITLVLTIDSLPTTTWPGTNDTVTLAQLPVTLTGGMPAGGTYTGTGVNNNLFYPAQAGVGTFNLTYTYTDSNGCVASANHIFVVTTTTGSTTLQRSLRVYPQPVNEVLIVESDMFIGKNADITLYDITGKLLAADTRKNHNHIQLQVSQLTAGTYFLKIQVGDEFTYIRFEKVN